MFIITWYCLDIVFVYINNFHSLPPSLWPLPIGHVTWTLYTHGYTRCAHYGTRKESSGLGCRWDDTQRRMGLWELMENIIQTVWEGMKTVFDQNQEWQITKIRIGITQATR